VWWVDFGCLLDPHPETLSLLLLSRTGEKIRQKSLWVEIKTV